MDKLEREFYSRDTLTVARELLGKVLVRRLPDVVLAGRIVETEAYRGVKDAAAHSYQNRRTGRTEVMFGPGGFAYVFLVYGMHYCMNVVTAQADEPEAVLLRAVAPAERYGTLLQPGDGPGKLCRALSIDKSCYGLDLCGDELYLLKDDFPEFSVGRTRRINIDYAGAAREYPWRFFIQGDPHVSGGKQFR